MQAETQETRGLPRRFFRSLIDRWGHVIQAVTAVAGVLVAVMAILIQQDIARQDEQNEKEEKRRAAIERSIALYDYFINSENTKGLIASHVDIQRGFSERKQSRPSTAPPASRKELRGYFVDSVLSATQDSRHVMYNSLALLLNDIEPIAECSKYEKGQWSDGGITPVANMGGEQPLCDRKTFHTLLFGPLSEVFFAYRFYFYCDKILKVTYQNTINKFEIMIADYLHYYYKKDDPDARYFVFLEQRDRELAVNDDKVSLQENFPILRISHESDLCDKFRAEIKSKTQTN